jgi:hypothetical protein
MTNDWILRVADGANFRNSSAFHMWGVKSNNVRFLTTVRPGDRLWFVINGGLGQAIAVATYRSHNERQLGPLINLTMTNDEVGWDNNGPNCDTEIHYTDLYNLTECEIYTHIGGQTSVRCFATSQCAVDLPVEYSYIVRYSKVSRNM